MLSIRKKGHKIAGSKLNTFLYVFLALQYDQLELSYGECKPMRDSEWQLLV